MACQSVLCSSCRISPPDTKTRVACQEVGQQGDVARRALVVDKRAAPEGHLGHVGCLEQVEGLLQCARELKTVPRSLLRK